MRRREAHPLEKVTLNLFKGDFERLREYHTHLGAGKVVRELVRGHIKAMEAKLEQVSPPLPKVENTSV